MKNEFRVKETSRNVEIKKEKRTLSKSSSIKWSLIFPQGWTSSNISDTPRLDQTMAGSLQKTLLLFVWPVPM